MAENYSLSDLAAVTGGESGLGGGAWWIIVLFLFVLMAGGGGGLFGGGAAGYSQFATAASQQEILFGQQFSQLADRINSVSNGLSSLGYEMQGNFGNTNSKIDNSTFTLAQQLSDCCCNTQRAIDGVNANIEAKFAALEKSQLEQRIAEQAARIASLEMDNRMYGVVRYPNGYTYSAGNSPFCGCNSSCCGCN